MMLQLRMVGDYCKSNETEVYSQKIWECDKCGFGYITSNDSLVELIPYLNK